MLLNHLLKIVKPETPSDKSFEQLKKEAEAFQNDNARKCDELFGINISANNIESS